VIGCDRSTTRSMKRIRKKERDRLKKGLHGKHKRAPSRGGAREVQAKYSVPLPLSGEKGKNSKLIKD